MCLNQEQWFEWIQSIHADVWQRYLLRLRATETLYMKLPVDQLQHFLNVAVYIATTRHFS